MIDAPFDRSAAEKTPIGTPDNAPRRGRPPGRSARQEEQRKLNRAAIVSAAAGVFATRSYIQTTIDDILVAAAISRATFYFHFESKLALAMEIYEGIATDWLTHFDRLASIDVADPGAVSRWTMDLVQLYIDHGYITPLVDQLAPFEPKFRQRLADDRDRLIDRLAEAGLPGCVRAVSAGPDRMMQRTRLRLLFQRLDQVCGLLARHEIGSGADAEAEIEAYISVIGEELRNLLG